VLGDFLLLKIMEQRVCINFCVKNGIKCSKTLEMLTVAYGESTLSKKNVYKWYKLFQEGRENVNDEPRSGRPSTSKTDENVQEVKEIVLKNRRITIREIADDLNISFGSCQSILTDVLGMTRVSAKFVPKLLNFDQKQRRMNIAQDMLNDVNDDPDLLKRVITGDETWVYGYDIETKAQSSQWKNPGEPRPKKARQVRSNVKVLLTVFFDYHGVVHQEFLPQGRTVNKEYYLEVMRRLRESIRKKRPEVWKEHSWILHHDNAPAHTSLLVSSFLAKNNTIIMPQPPYSPDLAPCDFFLFPKLKRPMKGRRFATIEEIKAASLEELRAIPKSAFQKCFDDWKKRWHKCIVSEGDYFEGDNIILDE
jgi:histone-lysine N-methyltransferase SETMAR